jgi:hypothetical protein
MYLYAYVCVFVCVCVCVCMYICVYSNLSELQMVRTALERQLKEETAELTQLREAVGMCSHMCSQKSEP